MANQNGGRVPSKTVTSTSQKMTADQVRRRKRAFANASQPDIAEKKKMAKVLREFVLNEDHAALIWRSVRVAHAAVGFTPDQFRESVENRAGLRSANWIDYDSFDDKKDPYRQLELQSWIKYLYYGGSRKRRVKDSQGMDLYEEDQDFVLKYFGIEPEYEIANNGDRQLKCQKSDYSWHMSPVLNLRNELGGHSNVVRVEELTLERLMYYYDGLMGALKPLVETRWVVQEECAQIVDTLQQNFFGALGKVSYSVKDIMEQQYMDLGKQSEVEDLLNASGVAVVDGCVEVWGDIRDYSMLLKEAFRYYQLSPVSGAEQMRAGIYEYTKDVVFEEEVAPVPKEKSVLALRDGGPSDWTELADRYRLGEKGVEESASLAVEWYEKAANADAPDLRAMFELGQILERKDPVKGLEWYRKAANAGYVPAQVQLGLHCMNGTRKQTRNWKEAVAWFLMAAEKKDATALYQLGVCYAAGYGVEQNDLQAALYYSRGQEAGSLHAKAAWAALQLRGRGVPKDEQAALKTLRELAQQSCDTALVELGICHHNGIGVARDRTASLQYFRKAAKLENVKAMHCMGWYCENGYVVGKDAKAARQWYMRAARMGHVGSQLKCADKALQGERWIRELVSVGNAPAQVKLAKWNMEENPGEAVRLLTLAKDASVEGKRLLAECYLHGRGVKKDHEQARVLAEWVVEYGKGKEQMLAESVLAEIYQREQDESKWVYWASRAARKGHVRWALEVALHYNPKHWESRRENHSMGYKIRHVLVEAKEGFDLSKTLEFLGLAAQNGSSQIAGAVGDFYSRKSCTVVGQTCTDFTGYEFATSTLEVDLEQARHFYRLQKQKAAVEKKAFPFASSAWRYWG